MSAALERIKSMLARFDEDAFIALANRGLLRRARKDIEQQPIEVLEVGANELIVTVGAHRVHFDERGPAHARCPCPASGVCQHILAAAIGLQQQQVTTATSEQADANSLASLCDALLAMSVTELVGHAGKAGYRWAWQYVQDMESSQTLAISGTQNLVLELKRPPVTFRYMGGDLSSLIADGELPQIEKYRVAVVLAFQQVNGREIAPLEPTARPRSQSLGLGNDHALVEPRNATIDDARTRLRGAIRRILVESVELGLTHLSRGIHERYATLAVAAQGAEYPRLALLIRRIADHIEHQLERSGGADELQLLDEMTITFGLVSALERAAESDERPLHLVGRTRSRYESVGTLELIGLGAHAWRSASGYVGLTMIFWSPHERAFMACTDARPATLRGFNPIARYTAIGPWAGLGAPAQATGQRVLLNGANVNDVGRISALESCSASLIAIDGSTIVRQLQPFDCWRALRHARIMQRRSLLAEPQPMKDWVALRPARFGSTHFDEARQTLVWPLFDGDGLALKAELAFDQYSQHCISRIEQLRPIDLVSGSLVIARLHTSFAGELVAQPISLIRPGQTSCAVDALWFDVAEGDEVIARALGSPKPMGLPTQTMSETPIHAKTAPPVWSELRQSVQQYAERGIAAEHAPQVLAILVQHCKRLADAGLTEFINLANHSINANEFLLRLNYVMMQCDRLSEGRPLS